MAEGKIIRKGGGGAQTAAPTITLDTARTSHDTLWFSITNESNLEAEVYIYLDSDLTTEKTYILAAGATQSDLFYTSLTENTNYTISAYAINTALDLASSTPYGESETTVLKVLNEYSLVNEFQADSEDVEAYGYFGRGITAQDDYLLVLADDTPHATSYSALFRYDNTGATKLLTHDDTLGTEASKFGWNGDIDSSSGGFVVGGYYYDGGRGAVAYFKADSSTTYPSIQVNPNTQTSSTADYFGDAVACNSTKWAASAWREEYTDGTTDAGIVYIYTFPNYSRIDVIDPSNNPSGHANQYFGRKLAMNETYVFATGYYHNGTDLELAIYGINAADGVIHYIILDDRSSLYSYDALEANDDILLGLDNNSGDYITRWNLADFPTYVDTPIIINSYDRKYAPPSNLATFNLKLTDNYIVSGTVEAIYLYELDTYGGPSVVIPALDTGEDFGEYYIAATSKYLYVAAPLENDAGTDTGSVFVYRIAPEGTMDEAIFTEPGAHTWTCPDGVTSVNAVCIGGGASGRSSSSGYGGGGGGLGWKNNIAVTPGQNYTVYVGSGGAGGTNTTGTAGTTSYFINSSTVSGGGGQRPSGGTYTGDGGGNGGAGGSVGGTLSGGGGGAGGYSGAGGAGGTATSGYAADGAGGAGGGGGTGDDSNIGGCGGGVDIFGEGTSGLGGANCGFATTQGGGHASGGSGGYPSIRLSYQFTHTRSGFGSGGGGTDTTSNTSKSGGNGAVRLIWRAGSAFPSTNVGPNPE